MTIARSLILLAFTAVPTVSMAQVSANFGMVSDYIYRGIFQSSSSASAGLDFEHDSGFLHRLIVLTDHTQRIEFNLLILIKI